MYLRIFSIAQGSAEFDAFLDVLGTRVALKGWEKYSGGLDTGSTLFHL